MSAFLSDFSARDKRALSRSLKKIKQVAIRTPQRLNGGICVQVTVGQERILKSMFKDWPRFSGHPAFPVPDPWNTGAGAARDCYWQSYGKRWIGDQGKLRLELLNWLIEQLAPFDKRGVRKAKP